MINAKELALLILLRISDYQEHKNRLNPNRQRDVTRVVMKHAVLLSMSNRTVLPLSFLNLVYAELELLGWYAMDSGTGSLVAFRMDVINNWTRLGAVASDKDTLYARVHKNIKTGVEYDRESLFKDIEDEVKDLIWKP